MSAWICPPRHIATCAKAICETAADSSLHEVDVRMLLAKENVASVAYRYGPAGHAAYAPILNEIVEGLAEQGHKPENIQVTSVGQNEPDVDTICFGDGDYTTAQYFMDCRTATPVPYTDSEAYMYLGCYQYQACEHSEWEESKAFELTERAILALAARVAGVPLGGAKSDEEILEQASIAIDKELHGRHVWLVPEEDAAAARDSPAP